MKIHDRIKWLKANADGWAGNGEGKIVAYDPARRYFEGHTRGDQNNPPTGPAVCIMLDTGFDAWVPPQDLTVVEAAP